MSTNCSPSNDAGAALEQAQARIKELSQWMIELENMALLGEMFGGVAHEMNQPLNVTKIICQGILHDVQKNRFSAEEAKTDLPEIVTQMNKLSEIIAHMRSLTRSRSKISVEKQELNTIVKSALQFVSQQYKDHKINIVLELGTTLPYVMADAICMEQTVLNLMNQARQIVEPSQSKEKKLTLKTCVFAEGREVVLEISGNVAGQADEFRLAACRKTMEDHQGRLDFEDRPGEGCFFKATLPAVINI